MFLKIYSRLFTVHHFISDFLWYISPESFVLAIHCYKASWCVSLNSYGFSTCLLVLFWVFTLLVIFLQFGCIRYNIVHDKLIRILFQCDVLLRKPITYYLNHQCSANFSYYEPQREKIQIVQQIFCVDFEEYSIVR